jgi:hypothetical protein
LRSAARVHFHHTLTSFFRFVSEVKKELAPSGIQNGFREFGFCEALDIQVFNSDQTESVDQPSRKLVREVLPLRFDFFVLSR